MYLLGIIIIIIDGILVYLIPSYFNELSYFYPMLTITLIVAMYNSCSNYLKTSFILGIIYDLFYSNVFLYNTLLFLLLSKINKKIFKYLQFNNFNKILVLVINILIYDGINYFIVWLTKYNLVTISDLFYKISHSLIMNILAIFVLNFILKKIRIRHKI